MDAEALISPALSASHGFFTRRGGVSAGPYASLNCSLSGGDDPAAVAENRARVARAVGVGPDCLLGMTQVHGCDVILVKGTQGVSWGAGRGPRGDAMVTNRRGLALGVITADCAPVLFADTTGGVIGAAHAGWRGAVAGVLDATVDSMVALGADPGRIVAAIGPCIRQPSYEVGADLRAAVLEAGEQNARFFRPAPRAGHWQFDLAGFCAARLLAAGVSVDIIDADTLADESRFFSHRRRTLGEGGPIGHQISVIAS